MIPLKKIEEALLILPKGMDSPEARVMLLAIGLQESRFTARRQLVGNPPKPIGPAKGFWQFELGTAASRGGVWGVFLHEASNKPLKQVAIKRGTAPSPINIWNDIENDDVLAATVARLLLWTDPKALPKVGDSESAWQLYLRTWRPGKPHRATWDALYSQAVEVVKQWK